MIMEAIYVCDSRNHVVVTWLLKIELHFKEITNLSTERQFFSKNFLF